MKHGSGSEHPATPAALESGSLLSVDQALVLGRGALRRIGFSEEEAQVIALNLVDAELCGYPALGLARILTIAEHPRMKLPRRPPLIVHETPLSALVDGGNTVGFYAAQRAARVAIEKASASGFALVGMHNSYLSGRNGYYLESIARAGLVGIHTACSAPVVVPLGGIAPAFGTNPIAFGFPSTPDPLIFDMSTSALNHGDLILASRLGRLLPEGAAVDAQGNATRDPIAALAGGILPFGGYKGQGLSLSIQALGLLAGAALPRGEVQDFAFLFIVFDPELLLPRNTFHDHLAQLLARVRAAPRKPGAGPVRLPSERAFHERALRRTSGICLPRAIHDRIAAV